MVAERKHAPARLGGDDRTDAQPPRRRRGTLVLTLTRECNLRCSYCPTVKSGWPSLRIEDVDQAMELFASRYGGGDVKLFGGEPLLFPELVDRALEVSAEDPRIHRIYLSTNGLGLDGALLERLAAHPKLVLTVSMDGRPEDHDRLRRALPLAPPEARDSYDHLLGLMPILRTMKRAVVTQTIAPATAHAAAENYRHLRALGWRRFNFLPGYYVPWKDDQLAALRRGFRAIADDVRGAWAAGERLYIRNLFTWVPTPFFNVGLVVDSDASIHAGNVGLASAYEDLLDQTRLGTLASPPSPEDLAAGIERLPELIAERVPGPILAATRAADAELSTFCRGLYPAYLAKRAQRSVA